MIHIESRIFIDRSPEQVFDFVADGRNEPQYNSHVVHAEQTSAGPVGRGTRFRFEAKTPGRRQTVRYEITDYDRPRRIASRVIDSPMMDVEATEDFDAVAGGTRVRWSFDVQPRGVFKVATPLIARVLERRLDSTFANLKSLLEGRAKPLGASQEIPIFRTEETRAAMKAIYDEGLRQWPVPFEAFSVPTRHGKTHLIAAGDAAAPPLVLLHPMGAGSFGWSSIVGALSKNHRVYAVDTIGDVGRSELDDPERHPRTGRDYSEWLTDVYRAVGLASADVVAGSMGGWIAIHHAINAPDRVNRLVLLGPMGLPSLRTTLGVLGPMIWYVARPTPAKLDRLITRSLGEGERVNQVYRPWMRLLGQCAPRVGQPFHIRGRELRKIKSPTLIFLGGKDGLIGSAAAAADRARRDIAGCQIEILPGAGHVMYIDEPELVGTRIAKFLGPSAGAAENGRP